MSYVKCTYKFLNTTQKLDKSEVVISVSSFCSYYINELNTHKCKFEGICQFQKKKKNT